jgi:hypothetical protein
LEKLTYITPTILNKFGVNLERPELGPLIPRFLGDGTVEAVPLRTNLDTFGDLLSGLDRGARGLKNNQKLDRAGPEFPRLYWEHLSHGTDPANPSVSFMQARWDTKEFKGDGLYLALSLRGRRIDISVKYQDWPDLSVEQEMRLSPGAGRRDADGLKNFNRIRVNIGHGRLRKSLFHRAVGRVDRLLPEGITALLEGRAPAPNIRRSNLEVSMAFYLASLLQDPTGATQEELFGDGCLFRAWDHGEAGRAVRVEELPEFLASKMARARRFAIKSEKPLLNEQGNAIGSQQVFGIYHHPHVTGEYADIETRSGTFTIEFAHEENGPPFLPRFLDLCRYVRDLIDMRINGPRESLPEAKIYRETKSTRFERAISRLFSLTRNETTK